MMDIPWHVWLAVIALIAFIGFVAVLWSLAP